MSFLFQFVLKRPITRRQMFGAFLIVISLTIAKAPALLKDFFSTDEPSIGKAALVAAASAKNTSSPNEVPTEVQQTSAVNALPIQAVVLALVAACISGQYSTLHFKNYAVQTI